MSYVRRRSSSSLAQFLAEKSFSPNWEEESAASSCASWSCGSSEFMTPTKRRRKRCSLQILQHSPRRRKSRWESFARLNFQLQAVVSQPPVRRQPPPRQQPKLQRSSSAPPRKPQRQISPVPVKRPASSGTKESTTRSRSNRCPEQALVMPRRTLDSDMNVAVASTA